MLINLSNHPYEKWSDMQRRKVLIKYTDLLDISFPAIDPEMDEHLVLELAKEYKNKCIKIFKEESKNQEDAVHIMGEFTFTFALVSLLMNSGIKCIASTTKRKVVELDNNKSEVTFEFVKFREYSRL